MTLCFFLLICPGIRLQIRKEFEARFGENAMRRFGFSKGSLSRAAEEAIEKWLVTVEEVKFDGDPVAAIDGLLSDIKLASVKLQHRISKMWTETVAKDVSRRHKYSP